MPLPKLTMKLRKKMDAPNQAKASEERLKLEYEFLKEVFESDKLQEALDGSTLDEVDITALETLYLQTVEEYEAPVTEARLRKMEKVAEMFNSIDLAKMSDLMDKSRQGFRNVL